MRFSILSRQANTYSTQRLVKEARACGHSADVLDTLRCYIEIRAGKPTLHYQGKQLPQYDTVIPRIGASITFYGTAVLRQLEMMGVLAANGSLAIARSRDKLRCMQLLSKHRIGLPATAFSGSHEDIESLITLVGGTPLIIKLLEGTQGIGVMLAETRKAARSTIEAFMNRNVELMVQEYIQEAQGKDIRCFVVGGQVVGALERTAKSGEFRSNLHRGGAARLIDITEEERALAIRATKTLGLNISGVDLLRSQRGPLLMEVNASPGLQGIEKTTGENIARHIITFLETEYAAVRSDTVQA